MCFHVLQCISADGHYDDNITYFVTLPFQVCVCVCGYIREKR